MLHSIHHLTFVVRDLETTLAHFTGELMIGAVIREPLPARGVLTARFQVGAVWFVLVQPVADGAPVRQLSTRGEGLLVVSFEVRDLDAALSACAERGIATLGDPRDGLSDWRVADLDIRAVPGAMTQLCQPTGTCAPRP